MRLIKFEFGNDKWRRNDNFEVRVERQLPALMRAARGFTLQQADAEDLVHDTCVKALAAAARAEFDSDDKFAAWIGRILVNTYRDQYRRQQRSPVRATDYHATSENDQNVIELVATTELTPLESVENRRSSNAIDSALAGLPPEVRVVSVLFLVSELSYREIADVTDCPIGTVMSRLARGRQLLRRQLGAYAPPGNDAVRAARKQHD